jgi:hypothetical protein
MVSANTLWKIAGAVFLVSFGWFFMSACVGVARSTAGMVSRDAANTVAWGVLGMLAAAAIASLAWLRQYREQHPRPLIRLKPMEKPPGWNRAVLHWFLNGPELRRPTDEYRAAFRERARSGTFDRPWGHKQERDQ